MNNSTSMMRGTEAQDRPIERARRGRRYWLFAGAGAPAVLLLAAFVWPSVRSFLNSEMTVPAAAVRIATVSRGRFISDVSAQGTVGASSVGDVEILTGLTEGDQIVVSNLDLFQGAALARLVQ